MTTQKTNNFINKNLSYTKSKRTIKTKRNRKINKVHENPMTMMFQNFKKFKKFQFLDHKKNYN